ncbi:MAG: hypothetical protein AUJ51_07670 [Elusimicrobia bacterium CG1_02_56_21]|nr:MAG: hypothetical protein AUJ51_07670 [Elusimicrobia bacterium CG1_02_56_21]
MNEQEQSELFNRELDGFIRDGGQPAFAPEPGAMSLAVKLAGADFSGDSLIKESLRARLAGAPGFTDSLRSAFAGAYVRVSLAAAVLLLALLPLVRRPAPVPVSSGQAKPKVIAGLPLPAPALSEAGQPAGLGSSAPSLQSPRKVTFPSAARPAGIVFVSVPMRRLETEPVKEFPIAEAGAGLKITLAEGRPIMQGTGPGIVLKTERAPFPIERRVIKPEDLFERRIL